MWGRRRLMPALVLAATLAASGASAQAAVRLGPDLTPESGIPIGPNAGFAGVGCQKNFTPCSWVNLRSTDATNPVAAPTDGVITRWSFRITCCGAVPIPGEHTLKLATFRQGTHDGDFGYAYAIPMGTPGPSFVVPDGNTLPITPPTSVPVRMPIKAGERVGVVGDDAFFIPVYGPPGVTAASISNGFVDRGELYGQAWAGVAWAYNVEVEPDADGDGYGDETQDCAPADPGRQGTCAPPPTAPVVTPAPVGVSSPGPPACGNACPTKGAVPTIGSVAPPASGDPNRIFVALSCPPTSPQPCGGFLVLSLPLAGKAGAAAAPKVLGRVAYSVAPGGRKRIAVPLSKAGRALLRRRGKLTVRLTVRPESGAAVTYTRTLRHRTPKRGR